MGTKGKLLSVPVPRPVECGTEDCDEGVRLSPVESAHVTDYPHTLANKRTDVEVDGQVVGHVRYGEWETRRDAACMVAKEHAQQ